MNITTKKFLKNPEVHLYPIAYPNPFPYLGSMPNIKFNYLYRDSGNYKKSNSVIFANPEGIELSDLEAMIKTKLIWDTWFYAEQWNLPEIFTGIVDFRVDPTWHEFENIAYTDEPSGSTFTLIDFIDIINNLNR